MPVPLPDPLALSAACERQSRLTKPLGSLGRLETLACRFAAWQGLAIPRRLQPAITVFAADHGVCCEGVSAYPAAVTVEMVHNFTRGGAAINVLARETGARLEVVDVGVAGAFDPALPIVHAKVRAGSGNLLREPAMSGEECAAALEAGRQAARRAIEAGATLLIAGDMGIGNTTASACLIAALAGLDSATVAGRGTGIDDTALERKRGIIAAALQRASGHCTSPADWLAEVGGLEIAAMAGFYLEAARLGQPALVDGFIATAAALAACRLEPATRHWLLASHCSHEQGHAPALAALELEPLVDLQLRLGEGSGAALVVPLLQAAIALHAGMATFAEAGVSDKDA